MKLPFVVSGLTASLLLVLGPGCFTTHEGNPYVRVKPEIRTESASLEGDRWRAFVIGPRPTGRVDGFLRTEELAGFEHHWVYNEKFQLVGWIESRGLTIRRDSLGKHHTLGAFDLDRSILEILLRDSEQQVKFMRLPEST
ncbi:MAG: hypothetical protein KDD82_23580 [Planctomycetes bacterium]|nr:hypothetical protein [Planctomycetota bacterium]